MVEQASKIKSSSIMSAAFLTLSSAMYFGARHLPLPNVSSLLEFGMLFSSIPILLSAICCTSRLDDSFFAPAIIFQYPVIGFAWGWISPIKGSCGKSAIGLVLQRFLKSFAALVLLGITFGLALAIGS